MAEAMEETVQTLSAKKQRKSLGESTKKMKALNQNKPTRTTVVNPREIEWPDLDDEASAKLLSQLEESIKCLKIPCRHVPLNEIRTVPKSERSAFRKRWSIEKSLQVGYDVDQYTLNRSALSLGVNCVSRALEMDHIAGVIIEKDVEPQIITKLLIPVARSKDVPIVSVCGLRSVFKKVTGMRCIALGFKKACNNVSHQFYSVLKDLKENVSCDSEVVENVSASEADTTIVSVSLSSEVDEKRGPGGPRQSQPSLPSPVPDTFSVEEEIEKLTKKVEAQALKRKIAGTKSESGFVPPKIRRVTPK